MLTHFRNLLRIGYTLSPVPQENNYCWLLALLEFGSISRAEGRLFMLFALWSCWNWCLISFCGICVVFHLQKEGCSCYLLYDHVGFGFSVLFTAFVWYFSCKGKAVYALCFMTMLELVYLFFLRHICGFKSFWTILIWVRFELKSISAAYQSQADVWLFLKLSQYLKPSFFFFVREDTLLELRKSCSQNKTFSVSSDSVVFAGVYKSDCRGFATHTGRPFLG